MQQSVEILLCQMSNSDSLFIKMDFLWNYVTLLVYSHHIYPIWKKEFHNHFTCQDRHILQWSKEWEVMWHQQKHTHTLHPPPPPPTHRHHTHINPFFVVGRNTVIHLLALKTRAASKHGKRHQLWALTETSTQQKAEEKKSFCIQTYYELFPFRLPLTSTRCCWVSCFRPPWHWADHPPPHPFTPCWRSGDLSLGRQRSLQAWKVRKGCSHIAHFEGMEEACEFLN